MITILDYGINNLSSVSKAVAFLGFEHQVRSDLAGATKLLIPGVGAFRAAMERLRPLASEIKAFAGDGNPLMGICLGQQLLFESSEEHGFTEGLGLVPGRVRYLPGDQGLKVPHMGWAPVDFLPGSSLAEGLQPGDQVYFVHSLYCECADPKDVAGTADYGVMFAAAIERGNIWGTQFHPEKSGAVGLQVLKNFLQSTRIGSPV